eukprot:8487605-Alexandrium_andersonii.AAC.1
MRQTRPPGAARALLAAPAPRSSAAPLAAPTPRSLAARLTAAHQGHGTRPAAQLCPAHTASSSAHCQQGSVHVQTQ